jgi:hypothetical protein
VIRSSTAAEADISSVFCAGACWPVGLGGIAVFASNSDLRSLPQEIDRISCRCYHARCGGRRRGGVQLSSRGQTQLVIFVIKFVYRIACLLSRD